MSSLNVPNNSAINRPILRRLGGESNDSFTVVQRESELPELNAPLPTLSVALEVREILDTVMSFLKKRRDLFATSLVCRTWTPVALDHLWRTLDSVVPLCRLLGPMQFLHNRWVSTNGLFPFSQALIQRTRIVTACLQRYTDTILGADWTRFEFYSQKVRRINNQRDKGGLGPGTLTQVVNIRPPSIPYILPRVTEINWTEHESAQGILDLTPLLSPTLKSFALDGTRSNSNDVGVALRHLVFLPGLRLESFHAGWGGELDGPLCDILDRHRDSLKSFSHHWFKLEGRLLNSLVQLVNLANLELKLEYTLHTDEDYNNFSDVLSSRCPGLKRIQFNFRPTGRTTFYAIQPLTRIKELREIWVGWEDLDLKVEDFREMGDAWRSLVVLGFPNSGIPLPWLATIAERFSPTLEDIDMEIKVPDDLNPDCTILTPFTPSLKRISYIGSAKPETFDAVGSFFCKLVASNTVVECLMEMAKPLRNVTGNSVKWGRIK